MAIKGSDVVLLVNVASGGEGPVWQAVGAQSDVKFNEQRQTVEVSSKESEATQYIYGKYSASVDLDHFYLPTDIAYSQLTKALRDGELIRVRRRMGEEEISEADALVTKIAESFKDGDVGTVSTTIEITGEWRKI